MHSVKTAQIKREHAYRALRDAVQTGKPHEEVQDLAHVAAETSGVFWVAKLREAMEGPPPRKHRI
jgi:hypothetical protein